MICFQTQFLAVPITKALSAMSLPHVWEGPPPGRDPHPRVIDMPSPSSGLGGPANDLISCSAALQMTPGSQTQAEDGDALMHHNGGVIKAGKGSDAPPQHQKSKIMEDELIN